MSWVERSTGISPAITNSYARNRHRRSRSRRVWPLSCRRRSWTPGSSSPRTSAQRRTPAHAQVEC